MLLICCRQVSSNDFPGLENSVKRIVKEKQPFERLEMKKEDLLKMFEVHTLYCDAVARTNTIVFYCRKAMAMCDDVFVLCIV